MKREYITPTFHLTGYRVEESLTLSNKVDGNPDLDDNNNWVESDYPF